MLRVVFIGLLALAGCAQERERGAGTVPPPSVDGDGGVSSTISAPVGGEEAVAAYVAARQESRRLDCECTWELRHSSFEDCMGDVDLFDSCATDALIDEGAAWAPLVDCMAATLQGTNDCVTAGGCGQRGVCIAEHHSVASACVEAHPELSGQLSATITARCPRADR